MCLPVSPKMQRQRGNPTKKEVHVVRQRSQQAGVLSASPAAGAGHHTWHTAQATPADVSLVSQLYVCVRDTDTHSHTVNRDFCPLPMGRTASYSFPIPPFLLSLPSS